MVVFGVGVGRLGVGWWVDLVMFVGDHVKHFECRDSRTGLLI